MRPSGDNSIYQRPPVQQQMAPPSNQVVPQIQPQIQPTIQNKQQQFVIHSQQQAVIHPQGLQQQLMVRPTVQQHPQQQIQNHHPMCNTQIPPTRQMTTINPMMTQSYPGPGILQPQKVSSQSTSASSNEQNANAIDKEFLAELEKNLGNS